MPSASADRITHDVLSGYGLIRLPLAEAVEAITVSAAEQGWDRRVFATGHSLSAALEFLNVVTWPATRYLAFPVAPEWTAVVNNQRGGSDVADLFGQLRRTHAAMAVRVVDNDPSFIVQNGFRVRLQYEARIVEIHANNELIRSITCADDGGRWTFDLAGTQLPIEERFDYDARRKRDRFTKQDLADLLRSIGARSVMSDDLSQTHEFKLITATTRNTEWQDRIEARACSAAQAADPAHGYFQRGMGWADHMATHAPSVVADLGKAVLLNPEFEPRCREALDLARAQLGDDAFQEALGNAHTGLRSV